VLGTIRTRESNLQLKANPRLVTRDGKRVNPYAGPLAILIDGRSYSASEFFAGGMQAIGRARVFGRKSPGGALGAAMDRLPNGDVLEHAISDFETAAGTRLEGRGVIPDTPVSLTRRDLLEGRDRDLEAALDWIDTEIAAK
jgi:carboxyl-terminal processing protease